MSVRIWWEGSTDGCLGLRPGGPIRLHRIDNFEQWLDGFYQEPEPYRDEDAFTEEELFTLGQTLLFMAIREIPPTRRGTTLDDAARLIGGRYRNMHGWDFELSWAAMLLDPINVPRGCAALAWRLRPYQTDAQPILRQAAFDSINLR